MTDTHFFAPGMLAEKMARFAVFVRQMDHNTGLIRFRDSAGFLGREEGYKTRVAEEARKELMLQEWEESWIGTGKIAECAGKAIEKAANLVYINQIIDFKNRLDPKHPKYHTEAERVLYNIFRNPLCEDSEAFTAAVSTFGAKYDTIAFLFFVKDDTRFLPVSTGHFDKAFKCLGIDYTTSFHCSWENYRGYLDIIGTIQTAMENSLPIQGKPRLIDAHSFVWIIQEDRFLAWEFSSEQKKQIEQIAESYLQKIITGQGGRYSYRSIGYVRSAKVAEETKKRAKGICQYCQMPAPFSDKNGEPYLEVHHVVWLSRGGEDSTENTVALCPNCHTRMHILDDPNDVSRLRSICK